MKLPILILFLLFSELTLSQQTCDFTIDTISLLKNKNLKRLIDSLQITKLLTRNDKKYIPNILTETINCWKRKLENVDDFAIANPDEFYNPTDIRVADAPNRQIIYLGISKTFLLMTYKYGGMGISYHIMIVKFANGKIVDFWNGFGDKLKTKAEILSYLKKKKNKLQTNFIDI